MYNPDNQIICIDVGGTDIKYAALDYNDPFAPADIHSMPAFNKNLKLPPSGHVVDNIGKIINGFAPNKKDRRLWRVSIAVPGIISDRGEILTGVVLGNKIPLKEIIERKYHVRSHAENDANCGAYANPNGQTVMIGTNVGSGLKFEGKLIGRNTQRRDNWWEYCIFDEAGFAIRLGREEAWKIFEDYVPKEEFDAFFNSLSAQNTDSPGLVRLEQLLGGNAIPGIFSLLYRKPVDARMVQQIIEGDVKEAEFVYAIEGRVLGFAVARLQNEARAKAKEYGLPAGYRLQQFHIGGGVAKALPYMLPSAIAHAKYCDAHDFELRKSPYPNPNIIGAAIAFK